MLQIKLNLINNQNLFMVQSIIKRLGSTLIEIYFFFKFNFFPFVKIKRLNLYEEPNMEPPESESHCYLKIGDCLWIVLSE